jgi:hypothetical protein
MSYKLQYALLVPVPGSMDPDGIAHPEEGFADALRDLADRIESQTLSVKDVFRSPVSSEREDRWVQRRIEQEGLIRSASGVWIFATPQTLNLSDTWSSEEILKRTTAMNRDAVWMRPENLSQNPVLATIRDTHQPDDPICRMDLADWLAWAGEEAVIEGIKSGWDFSFLYDSAASPCPDTRNDEVDPVHQDPNFKFAVNLAAWTGTAISILIDEEHQEHARSYIEDLYPGLFEKIDLEDGSCTPEAGV